MVLNEKTVSVELIVEDIDTYTAICIKRWENILVEKKAIGDALNMSADISSILAKRELAQNVGIPSSAFQYSLDEINAIHNKELDRMMEPLKRNSKHLLG